MNQQQQIEKILELETKIREKQTSKFSAHTLVPVGLIIGIASSVFFFGVTFQRLNSLENGYLELKSDVKEELLILKSEVKTISNSIADIRVLLVELQTATRAK